MIERNLGNTERLARFCIGLGMALWLVSQPQFSALHWLAAVAAVALFLNALTSRCYLWSALGINTRQRELAKAPTGESRRVAR